MRKEFNPKDHVESINKWRIMHRNSTFTKKAMMEACNDFPMNNLFWEILFKSGLITRVSRSEYVFTNPSFIINVQSLQNVYNKYRNKAKAYYLDRQARMIEQQAAKDTSLENAKNLLLANGYKVFKPVGDNLYQELSNDN